MYSAAVPQKHDDARIAAIAITLLCYEGIRAHRRIMTRSSSIKDYIMTYDFTFCAPEQHQTRHNCPSYRCSVGRIEEIATTEVTPGAAD